MHWHRMTKPNSHVLLVARCCMALCRPLLVLPLPSPWCWHMAILRDHYWVRRPAIPHGVTRRTCVCVSVCVCVTESVCGRYIYIYIYIYIYRERERERER